MTELLEEPVITCGWPCAEIHETATEWKVEVETPGFGPEDLLVEVEGHTLAVFGRPEHGHEGSAFDFSFALPAAAQLERLRARFADGVLTISAPLRLLRDKRTLEIETPHITHAEACGG
jgi:HSP20 family protein